MIKPDFTKGQKNGRLFDDNNFTKLIKEGNEMYGYHCFWGIHWFFGIIFIVFIIWLILGRGYRGYYHHWGSYHMEERDRAINILKERYARGEISKEEFEEKRKDLMQ